MYTPVRPMLAVALLAGALVSACGGPQSSGRRFLSIGTAPPGGAFFVVGGALAEVLNEKGAERGWDVSAEATKGTLENIRRLVRGEMDLAIANSAITYFAVRGEPAAAWDRAYPVRSVMTLAPNVAMFVTPRSSGITTLADLRGRRVVVGVAGAGFDHFVRPLVEAHGVRYDEFKPIYNTQSGAVDLLSDGAADAAFLGGAVPTASITQAAAGRDVLLVPYDAEARQRLVERYPFFRPASVPAGTYRGQDQPYEGLDVGSMHLIAAADQDEELVYRLTRALYESRERVVAKHPVGRAINPRNAVRDTGTEFHRGAVRYYREIGIWPGSGPGASQ